MERKSLNKSPKEPEEGLDLGSPAGSSEASPAESGPPSEREIGIALSVLERLVEHKDALHGLDESDLMRLRVAAGRLALPTRLERRRFARTRRKVEAERIRNEDTAACEATSNRSRKRALAFPVPPPDLAVDEEQRRLLEHQARTREQDPDRERLHEPRTCYVCKADFWVLHEHYDSMCPPCAEFNWVKRTQTADLRGRVALVTGSRVKIGFEIVVMLLRAGARVIATTRFVCDAAGRFEKEPDFADWQDRLEIHPLDLRNTPAIERFCAELLEREERLDFLIHNACQTVRRPPAYYEEMVAAESPERLPVAARALVSRSGSAGGETALVARDAPQSVAALSTLDLLGEAELKPLFPEGIRDGEGQPLDLRDKNSWRMNLHEVSTVELLEVQLVNAIAPYVMNARLKPLMLRVPTHDKHIVNVSAMEGQFYRTRKTTRHPHTNMAKAALNMMTRTSAPDYAEDGIFMNSVDTGWVTDEDPFEKTVEKEETQRFTPPLDSVDGAARVLDPIFSGFRTGEHCWGQFLKDYAPTRW